MGLRDWKSRSFVALLGERRAAVTREREARAGRQSELDSRRAKHSKARRAQEEYEWRVLIDVLTAPVEQALLHPTVAGRDVRPTDVFRAIPGIESIAFQDDDQYGKYLRAIAYCLKVLSSAGRVKTIDRVDRDGNRSRRYRIDRCTEVIDGSKGSAGTAREDARA